jgi:hypothetical protein
MIKSISFGFLLIFLFTGCIQDVKAWEKDRLASETMKDGGPNKLLSKFEQHIYFSKEATRGGNGIAGGGCGCN